MNIQSSISGFGIVLSPITQNKLEKIRSWRNHPEIAEFMLDKSTISQQQQQVWFNSLPEKTHQLYFIISYKGEDIGVIYATSFPEGDGIQPSAIPLAKVISPGLYIAPDCKYKNSILAFSPSLVFIEYLFEQGSCQSLKAQVFNHNNSAIRYNEMLGYQQDEVDEQGVITMTLSAKNFALAKAKLSKILRF